ncbi:MAG: DUF6786 family protein [Pirellulaceae bacterium]
MERKSITDDAQFLRQHTELVELRSRTGGRVLVAPEWQGKTMTSSVAGEAANSYGWINYEFITSGRVDPQANLHGGEDRIWIAPEGSQFSFYFPQGKPMDFASWKTPALVDTAAFDVVEQSSTAVVMECKGTEVNYCGTSFDMKLRRTISVLDDDALKSLLNVTVPTGVNWVGHESRNELFNDGAIAWDAETGLPALWVLSMFKPSTSATLLMPFNNIEKQLLDEVLTTDYFLPLDEQRLKVDPNNSVIFFLGDGRHRSKIGLTHAASHSLLASWDDEIEALTVVQFNRPDSVANGYTKNLWRELPDPFAGDCVNAYNDGPNDSGGMLGPFYELETLSPALALFPGESYTHAQRTFHFEGDAGGLDQLCRSLFGVSIVQVRSQFAS